MGSDSVEGEKIPKCVDLGRYCIGNFVSESDYNVKRTIHESMSHSRSVSSFKI